MMRLTRYLLVAKQAMVKAARSMGQQGKLQLRKYSISRVQHVHVRMPAPVHRKGGIPSTQMQRARHPSRSRWPLSHCM